MQWNGSVIDETAIRVRYGAEAPLLDERTCRTTSSPHGPAGVLRNRGAKPPHGGPICGLEWREGATRAGADAGV